MAMLAAAVPATAVPEEAVTTIPEALINTALGMGTVFIVLILISFIIYLLGFVPDLLNGSKKEKAQMQPADSKRQPAPVQKPVSRPAPAPAPAVAKAADDTQLVAVITAAVAAAMEQEGTPVPADGLVIRSIKKRY